jgi:hypothetical protein
MKTKNPLKISGFQKLFVELEGDSPPALTN